MSIEGHLVSLDTFLDTFDTFDIFDNSIAAEMA